MGQNADRRGRASASPLLVLWLLLALTASGAQAAGDPAAGGSVSNQTPRALQWHRCSAGEYGTHGGWCRKCSAALPGCVECKDALTCTMCRAGHRTNMRSKCVKCQDRSCLLCLSTSARCSVCMEGFYVNPAGRCLRCQAGCAGACNADGTCSTACLEGYGKAGGVCRKCRQSACENCDGNVALCKRCFPLGYGLVAGRCRACNVYECARCADGDLDTCEECSYSFYKSVYDSCDPCSAGCEAASCNPDGTCRRCLPGYGLVNGYCTACDVPNTELVPYNACDRCDGNVTRCTKCVTHYGLMPGGTCGNCTFTDDTSDVCEQCNGNIDRCSSCGSMQYRTPRGKCNMCTDTLQHCSTCTDANTCTSCWVGHVLIRGRCAPCPRGCEDCTGNRFACRVCRPFHVRNPRTLQCIPY